MKAVLLIIGLLVLAATAHADDCLFRTYGQKAWGTSPSGNNSAAYRNAHFNEAFPNGVRIGTSEGNSILFTSSRAVQLYLPTTGAAASLLQNGTNLTSSASGALGGEVLSLALNIGFDLANESFSPSTQHFEDLHVTSGACSGMLVKDVFAQAQRALAGLSSTLTPVQAYNCSALINTNFENVTQGNLACTSPLNETVPVVNQTPENFTNTTQNASVPPNSSQETVQNISATLRIAPWYPKGTHYVFYCNSTINATNYSWWFGDGQKLLNIRNQNVYHIYAQIGAYNLVCSAMNATTAVNATMSVVVT